jgi:excinuclease ABC subunit A
VDAGNTVVVIEHNLDVIKTADWIIDMGPEGGSGGGTIVAAGSPEHIATVPESHTGRFLGEILGTRVKTKPTKAAKAVRAVKAKPAKRAAPATRKRA